MEDDFTLLDRFESGEEGAFEQLVVRHQKVVYYLVIRIVGDHDDAADISQRSFIKAFREIGKFQRRSSFRTWLCRIAINMSRNHLKYVGRHEVVSLTEAERDKGDIPSEDLLKKERDQEIQEAISGLPERQRLTLILRSYHNMSHREIARVLDITENNSRANFFHALKNLKAILVKKGNIDEL